MVGRASTADHARQEPWAQWLEAGSALACWGGQSCAWFLYRRLRLFWRQPAWLALRSPFLMGVFARCPPAATRSPPSMIVRSILGTNALNPPAAWAAGAPRMHGGTGLDSRPRKARAVGAMVRSPSRFRACRRNCIELHIV